MPLFFSVGLSSPQTYKRNRVGAARLDTCQSDIYVVGNSDFHIGTALNHIKVRRPFVPFSILNSPHLCSAVAALTAVLGIQLTRLEKLSTVEALYVPVSILSLVVGNVREGQNLHTSEDLPLPALNPCRDHSSHPVTPEHANS